MEVGSDVGCGECNIVIETPETVAGCEVTLAKTDDMRADAEDVDAILESNTPVDVTSAICDERDKYAVLPSTKPISSAIVTILLEISIAADEVGA